MFDKAENLTLANMWVAFASFAVAAVAGGYQILVFTEVIPALHSFAAYFGAVSTHGTLMAYVFTTFFIMGFGYYSATTGLGRPLWKKPVAWIAFWVSLIGTVMAGVTLVLGEASVLYTFYPPLQAHPGYYIGATLLIVGSWWWCITMIVMMGQWKRDNPGSPVPLVMFATVANAILWLWTTAGVGVEAVFQLIPWSLGLIDSIDAGLARTLFDWTLHPIVYFWLIPAYIVLYTLLPREAGGRLFSDEMGRVVFVMLLIFSLPVGLHHALMDPIHSAGFKLFHVFSTFGVAIPTLLTGFTIMASLEIASRLRGGRGLFGWVWALDFKNPMVLAAVFAGLFLLLGGFGGMINAGYAMNGTIHNTAWVTAHFHLIFGGTTVIMYFAAAYYLWPKLTGRRLFSNRLALTQLWLWFIGMVVLSTPWHILGLLSKPRRISSAPYDHPVVESWANYYWLMLIGGLLMVISALLIVFNLWRTHANREAEPDRVVRYAEPIHPVLRLPAPLNGFALWNGLLVIYMIAAFAYPLLKFFFIDAYQSPGWGI